MNQHEPTHSGTARFAALCEAIEAARQEHKVPGVAVGVLYAGEEYTAGFGVTNVNHPLPVDADTLFQIGSTTKTVTATVAMQLVQAGKLDLDRPLRDYLPWLELQDPKTTVKVTLRHLFTHTGGWQGDFFIDTGRGDDALVRYVQRMRELQQEVPLGENFAYNDAGFSLAGLVIQEVAGKPYEQVIKELLLVPLGMDMSFFFPEEVMVHRFTVGHISLDEDRVKIAQPWAWPRAGYPRGGLVSSVRDQLRYARFHLGDGNTPAGQPLLATPLLKQMQQPLVKAPFGREIGIGWHIKRPGGLDMVGHGGAVSGQYSAFELIPEQNFALTLTTNGSGGNPLRSLMVQQALELFFGLTAPESKVMKLAPAELAAYAGHYRILQGHLDVAVSGNSLIIAQIPKPSSPDDDHLPSPALPPCPFVFIGPDQIEAREGSMQGMKGEFMRNSDGSIRLLHIFGRNHHKVA